MERELIHVDIAAQKIGATVDFMTNNWWLYRGGKLLRTFIDYNGYIDANDYRKWLTWMQNNEPVS